MQPDQSTASQRISMDAFGRNILTKYPNSIAPDGRPMSDLDPSEVAHLYLQDNPQYADYVDTSAYDQQQQQAQDKQNTNTFASEMPGSLKMVNKIDNPESKTAKQPFSSGLSKLDPTGDAARSIFSALIGNEQNFGGQIAAGIGGGSAAWDKQAADTQLQKNLQAAIQRRNELKAQGIDTSKADSLITEMVHGMSQGMSPEDLYSHLNDSAEQVYGAAGGVATDILAGGSVSRGTAAATEPARSTLGAVLKGAKTGAKMGGMFGAAQGVSGAMQRDESAAGVAAGGAIGAATGAAAGAVIGGTASGLSERAAPSTEEVAQYTMPKLSSQEQADAISAGRMTKAGLFKKAVIEPTPHDMRVAESVQDVVDPRLPAPDNIDAIMQKVTQTNQGVYGMIADHKVPFNTKQLTTALNAGKNDLKIVFASDPSVERTYDKVVEALVDEVKKKDSLGLFVGRQGFDQIPQIKKLLGTEGMGENVRREVVKAVRSAANDYIAEQLPANNPYKLAMRSESMMLEALENIGQQNASSINKNLLQVWNEKYPALSWIVGGLATAAGLGMLAGGVGAGSAILRSTD